MTTIHETTTVKLTSGVELPLIGYGTFPMRGEQAQQAVASAISIGYRAVDTAMRYRNEEAVGAAVSSARASGTDVLVTSKMATDQVGYERTSLEGSLAALGLDKLDIWLIHWPPGGSPGVGSWREFIRARDEGLVDAIGISNYSVAQIDGLIDATGTAPDLVQRSWSPVEFDQRYLDSCRDRGIALVAHSPLRQTPLEAPAIADAAQAHARTPAQVVLRWNIQHGVAVVPKSANPERMAQNLNVFDFELSPQEMAAIDALSSVPPMSS